MKNHQFKHGNVDVTITSVELPDGKFDVIVNATGDKAEVEALMRELVSGSAHLDLPFELGIGRVGEPIAPLKVGDLMDVH